MQRLLDALNEVMQLPFRSVDIEPVDPWQLDISHLKQFEYFDLYKEGKRPAVPNKFVKGKGEVVTNYIPTLKRVVLHIERTDDLSDLDIDELIEMIDAPDSLGEITLSLGDEFRGGYVALIHLVGSSLIVRTSPVPPAVMDGTVIETMTIEERVTLIEAISNLKEVGEIVTVLEKHGVPVNTTGLNLLIDGHDYGQFYP